MSQLPTTNDFYTPPAVLGWIAQVPFPRPDHRDSDDIPQLKVNHDLLQVRYDGKVYDITVSQADLLQALVDARGDLVSASGRGITKPSRVKKTLPEPIKALIETFASKGYRLKRIGRR